jgi:predicted phage tail protein
MINGVLTERTVKEVVPILKTNSDGLKKALEELVKQYKTKQDDMEKWKVRLQLCSSYTRPDHLTYDTWLTFAQKKNNVQVVQQPE